MKTNLIKCGVIAGLTAMLSACVVAPPQPIGYRMSAPMLPTYVNGQYVGMQPNNYIAPASAPAPAPAAANPATYSQQQATQTVAAQSTQQAPVYLQSTTPSVVYVQAPQPVYPAYYGPGYYPYGYPSYPYYSPFYAGPWWGGVGIGLGLRVRIR